MVVIIPAIIIIAIIIIIYNYHYIIVIIPIKRLAHANSTNATLGILKTKLAGYIKGMVATLKNI